ncbi:CaiB/BaiF CoA transferase family protein [Hymenobacter cheonanensis]|uniref:CaiB/BaiF CoA transferase family protein n=1 Tax=Hymenobacter sp. CA2-7 TaxID=3063993 RepID=UPI0027143A01|nr:CoA transferase [Hymenobacter sp. CA2-7]MDO7883914.1 CoA transferase [Hymenobacter sp. CA2-7]
MTPNLPFAGLRVLELATVLAGPQVGQFFAELGAAVLKVEPPAGDVTRTWRTPGDDPDSSVSAYFAASNWGKTSVPLDLTEPAAQAELQQLAAQADVLIASYKPGDAEKFGVGYAALAAANPRLIYAHLTGYGPASPRVGYDAVLQAETGFMHLNAASPADPPQKMPVALIDLLAAHQLKEGILTALYQREKTGRGALLAVSLLDSALASLANQGATWLVTGRDPVPLGSGHPGIVPYGTVYRAADGQRLVLAVGTDAQFRQLCLVLMRPRWAQEPRFATNPARVRHRAALEELLLVRIAELNGTALLHELARLGVPAGAVRSVGEALAHDSAQGMLLPAPGGQFPYQGLRTVAFRSSTWPLATHLTEPPPLAG